MTGLVTVIGGSGFIGRFVVQELCRTGVRVRVVTREPTACAFLRPLGGLGQVEIVVGDIRRPASIAAAVDGASAVVNLAGILSGDFDGIHADGAANVARAAKAAGAEALVHISALGADAESPSAYARSKAAGEAAVREAVPAATILRPSVVFGADDSFINGFARMVSTLPVVPVVAAATRFQPVYVLDLARAVAAAVAEPARFAGQTYAIGGPKAYSMRELIAMIMAETLSDKTVIELPNAAASLLASFGFLPGAPLTKDQWAMLQHDNVVEGEDGLAAFGIRPTPLEAIAPSYLVRYRKHGRFTPGQAAPR